MPNMERITWSGIALHGGPLPRYAASHGCVRMPYEFARVFEQRPRQFKQRCSGPAVIISQKIIFSLLAAKRVGLWHQSGQRLFGNSFRCC
jgi:hypothetical protein